LVVLGKPVIHRRAGIQRGHRRVPPPGVAPAAFWGDCEVRDGAAVAWSKPAAASAVASTDISGSVDSQHHGKRRRRCLHSPAASFASTGFGEILFSRRCLNLGVSGDLCSDEEGLGKFGDARNCARGLRRPSMPDDEAHRSSAAAGDISTNMPSRPWPGAGLPPVRGSRPARPDPDCRAGLPGGSGPATKGFLDASRLPGKG
jgi:hypothetical protein